MKYSMLMPYYNRSQQLKNTLTTFHHFYADRNDYEIIIIEDMKNIKDQKKHEDLWKVIEGHANIKLISYTRENCYNPAGMFNVGASHCQGMFLILTNPEVLHEANVLKGFDDLLEENPDQYYICFCKSVINVNDFETFEDMKYTINPTKNWYVHPRWNRRLFHFCSVLHKDLFEKIGGFSEEFINGIASEDRDFANKIKSNNIPSRLVPLVVCHQQHERFSLPKHEMQKRVSINREILIRKWGKQIYDS